MPAIVILALSTGSVFLLSFISILNPGKSNDTANRWLGAFLFCFGLALLSDLFNALHASSEYIHIIVSSEITRFAVAPSLYLSISCYVAPDRGVKRNDLFHFIPLLLFTVNCLPSFIPYFSGPLFTNRIALNEGGNYIRIGMFLVIKVQVISYWIASYVKLNRYQKNIKSVFSSLNVVDLKWLKYFLLSLLLIIVLWFNETIFGIKWINDYSSVGYLIATYALSYFALKQREIFPFQTSVVDDIGEIMAEKGPDDSIKGRLTTEQLASLTTKLNLLMEKEKCFLAHELGLPDLAEKMSLTCHELSYLLNKGIGMNFFEFVNQWRVEEAKILLLSRQHQHLNMLGIAYETGFNSKTTFNTAFKKKTGLSPSAFKKLATQPEAITIVTRP